MNQCSIKDKEFSFQNQLKMKKADLKIGKTND